MLYHYVASEKSGKLSEGELEAESLNRVLQFLSTKGLSPVSVQPVKGVSSSQPIFGQINLTDKVFLTRYLALMLRVGTDLLSAVNILIADFDKPAMKSLLIEVRNNLTRGQPFYTAFARYPKIFSLVFVNLVKAAEASGSLQQTFEDLNVSMQKESELRKRIRSAMVYPAILMVVAVCIFVFLSVFALPRISKVFMDSGIKPPLFSRVVFAAGNFVGDNIWFLLPAFIAAVVFLFYFFARTLIGHRIAMSIVSHAPVVKNVTRDIAIQRFASTFSSLMKAGLPIVQTTKICAEVVGYEPFRVALNRIADDGLSKGLTIGEAFRRETVFPKVVTNLVAISEKAGHLEDVLSTLADFYTSNIDANVRSLVAFLEPTLLLVMGILVATIALAIIVPVYQLTSQF